MTIPGSIETLLIITQFTRRVPGCRNILPPRFVMDQLFRETCVVDAGTAISSKPGRK